MADDLLVGPHGVIVVGRRSWPGPVTVTADGRLVRDRADHSADLMALQAEVDVVTDRLRRDGVATTARAVLGLDGPADRSRAPVEVAGVLVGGADHLDAMVARGRATLTPDLVAAVDATFADPPAAGVPSPMFDAVHRFLYLAPWSRGGRRRIYLNDRDGSSLGFTDLTTGAIELGDLPVGDRLIAETLLSAAEHTGITIGGRLLGRLASRHASLLVGQEWRAYGKHRLYGSLLDPRVTTSALGWVDLTTGERHPSADGPAEGDREAPDVYLRYLLHHRPGRQPSPRR